MESTYRLNQNINASLALKGVVVIEKAVREAHAKHPEEKGEGAHYVGKNKGSVAVRRLVVSELHQVVLSLEGFHARAKRFGFLHNML
jgi:hypothetical protein